MPGRKTARELRAAAAALRAAKRNMGRRRARPARPRRQRVSNQRYTRPLRQGVAAVTGKGFGSTRGRGHRVWFDANHPAHLSLPRAIGPYTVIRTTQAVTVTELTSLWGPFHDLAISGGVGEEKTWSNVCGVGGIDNNLSVISPGNTNFYQFDTMRNLSWNGARMTPAAFTIQVMNPSTVNNAAGIARIGRVRLVPDFQADNRLWRVIADELTAYNFPRLCSGGKLALRGVKVDAVPYDMSDLADFTTRTLPAAVQNPFQATWDFNEHLSFHGFAPIMILMDQAMQTAGGLDLLVTCEWRVRFDPSNPAQGSHTYHPVTTDSLWGRCQRAMEAAGHGCVDIAETVAEYGAALKGVEMLAL